MKKLISLSLILVLAFSLIACGGGAGSTGNGIVGKWFITDEEFGEGTKMIYDFKSDGKVNISFESADQAAVKDVAELFNKMEVTYKIEGDKLSMTSTDESFPKMEGETFKIDGDKLTIGEVTMTRYK